MQSSAELRKPSLPLAPSFSVSSLFPASPMFLISRRSVLLFGTKVASVAAEESRWVLNSLPWHCLDTHWHKVPSQFCRSVSPKQPQSNSILKRSALPKVLGFEKSFRHYSGNIESTLVTRTLMSPQCACFGVDHWLLERLPWLVCTAWMHECL